MKLILNWIIRYDKSVIIIFNDILCTIEAQFVHFTPCSTFSCLKFKTWMNLRLVYGWMLSMSDVDVRHFLQTRYKWPFKWRR